MTKDEALNMAIEALADYPYEHRTAKMDDALQACKKAVEPPVEPQYLYVYQHEANGISFGYKPHAGTNMWQTKVIGKIKLEIDNE